MRRAPTIEDWSRFNRAVLEVADGLPQRLARTQQAAPPPKREPAEIVSEPPEGTDRYGLITRHRWRASV